MILELAGKHCALLLVCALGAGIELPRVHAAECATQSQMPAAERQPLLSLARVLLAQIQNGNVQALRENTLPAAAGDFSAMSNSVAHLQPLIRSASVSVDQLYILDDATGPQAASPTEFYCGSPVVSFSFPSLPQGTYALAIVHATGVPQPQMISLILSRAADNRWMLAGLFDKPMIAAGHDGLWYWVAARKYAQQKMDWNAWFYYHMATTLLDPLDFLSSPNLQKLQQEAAQIRPQDLPGAAAMSFYQQGALFTVNAIDTTAALGSLDLDVHYTPSGAQAAQLSNPVAARNQVTAVMAALLRMHPELRDAFHGIWVHADQGSASLFALELPMNQIASATPTPPGYSVDSGR
jgi:hypothetical protein